MPANKFGRYLWLINLLRRRPGITFREISECWQNDAMSDGTPLPWRTFMTHKKKIETIFDVIIECGKGYGYHIADAWRLEGDALRVWLMESYATLHQIQAHSSLQRRILFEKIPSGCRWLTSIAEAMRLGKRLEIQYQAFGKGKSRFPVDPLCLKIANRRWYMIGRSPLLTVRGQTPDILHYALDRIVNITVTDQSFEMPDEFDPETYFQGCVGVIKTPFTPMVRLLIKATGQGPHYLRTLPLHDSQKEIDTGPDGSAIFEYHVFPTYDLYQSLWALGSQIEVLSPQSVRDQLLNHAKELVKKYARIKN